MNVYTVKVSCVTVMAARVSSKCFRQKVCAIFMNTGVKLIEFNVCLDQAGPWGAVNLINMNKKLLYLIKYTGLIPTQSRSIQPC